VVVSRQSSVERNYAELLVGEKGEMKVYNTLTRKKEEFVPLTEGKVGMYVCGPTVYDVPHIGHARSAYVFDVIRRYMKYKGLDVTFVRNVTDVDDKIIAKSCEELESQGKSATGEDLKNKTLEVSTRYLEEYHKAMEIMGISTPDHEPKATEEIPGMIFFIEDLISKGHAYAANGNVYFSIESFPSYGKLSGRDIEQLKEGVRIDSDENKRHPLDFALWKKVKPGEPFWESPWGNGRPGWHIECSVMSTSLLGKGFDIHGGGLDLIFPHHENEIAQSEASTGHTFAKYWMHNGFLTVNREKMSKSLKNYITINTFMDKYGDAELLKIMFLNSNYRSPVDYTDMKVNVARVEKCKIMNLLNRAKDLRSNNEKSLDSGIVIEFEEAMNDDFNAPKAMGVIFEAVKQGNIHLAADQIEDAVKCADTVEYFCQEIFGLDFKEETIDAEEEEIINKLVNDRKEARKNKDFAAADAIRAKLDEKGIVVEDTPEGTVWRKI
jgi:cysteinyl-tRNA synthetase